MLFSDVTDGLEFWISAGLVESVIFRGAPEPSATYAIPNARDDGQSQGGQASEVRSRMEERECARPSGIDTPCDGMTAIQRAQPWEPVAGNPLGGF